MEIQIPQIPQIPQMPKIPQMPQIPQILKIPQAPQALMPARGVARPGQECPGQCTPAWSQRTPVRPQWRAPWGDTAGPAAAAGGRTGLPAQTWTSPCPGRGVGWVPMAEPPCTASRTPGLLIAPRAAWAPERFGPGSGALPQSWSTRGARRVRPPPPHSRLQEGTWTCLLPMPHKKGTNRAAGHFQCC
jgi:hypothetical protein